MEIQVVIYLILVILALAVLVYYIASLSSDVHDVTDVEACRESIFLASETKTIANEPYFTLQCPRQDLYIKKKDVVEDGKLNQDKVNEIMAEAMVECWYMAGEGKIDPFSNYENLAKTMCLICKNIKFNEDFRAFVDDYESNSIDKDEMDYIPYLSYEYLGTNSPLGSDQTYFEQIFGMTYEDALADGNISLEPEEIKENSYILFSGLKMDTKSKLWRTLTGGFSSLGGLPDDQTLFSKLFYAQGTDLNQITYFFNKGNGLIVGAFTASGQHLGSIQELQEESPELFAELGGNTPAGIEEVPLCSILVN